MCRIWLLVALVLGVRPSGLRIVFNCLEVRLVSLITQQGTARAPGERHSFHNSGMLLITTNVEPGVIVTEVRLGDLAHKEWERF